MSPSSGRSLGTAGVLALLMCLFAAGMSARAGAAKAWSPSRTPAPAFSLPTRNGTVTLDSLRGRVVFVDFWASWCVPCRASFPWMSDLKQRWGDTLAIVAIDLDKSREDAEAFLAEHPPADIVAFDPAGHAATAWKVKAMPTSYVVGRDGTVRLVHAGFDPAETGAVEKAIAEAAR
jgi:thiol-disulfide isomerase/thioredoxin